MDIEKRLRQLHKIEPDPAYARDLRARLLMTAQPQLPKVTLRSFLTGILRSGSAMAAIGLVLFFALGGSVWKLVIGPAAQFAYLNPADLRAEAQAIDTQIYLANLQYKDPGYERQRLISPKTDFSSLTILPSPEDPKPPVAEPADTVASSTDDGTDDPANATSTPAAADDDTNATSTPAEPEDTTIDAGEALDILSR